MQCVVTLSMSAPGGAQCAHHQGAAAPCLRARRRLWPDLGDGPRSAPTPRRCSIRARRRGRRGRERKQSQRCRIARLADDGGGVDWRALGHRAGPTPRIARPAVRAGVWGLWGQVEARGAAARGIVRVEARR
eukprot:2086123-Rhodomonas_salina.1